MSFTLVSFHAHPDDEVLLTGGTLARAVAEGHRVVLVVATDGEAGLTASAAASGSGGGSDLGAIRVGELHRAAAALGIARVVTLGYPDSGMRDDTAPDGAFCRLDPTGPARWLARILTEEGADALTVYDAAGGYGHPDHRQVHRVGVLAAQEASTPVVLEATLDRTLLRVLVAILRLLPARPDGVSLRTLRQSYSPHGAITHRVDVRGQVPAKLRALGEHHSQARGGGGPRTAAMLLRLPGPLARLVLGREWFVERGRTGGPVLDDIFASLRPTGT